jgi:hypothetical protein
MDALECACSSCTSLCEVVGIVCIADTCSVTGHALTGHRPESRGQGSFGLLTMLRYHKNTLDKSCSLEKPYIRACLLKVTEYLTVPAHGSGTVYTGVCRGAFLVNTTGTSAANVS